MGIRVLCAAAAVALGVGQAEAATVNYDLWLRFEGTEYQDVRYYERINPEDSQGQVNIPLGGDWLGLTPLYFPDLVAGQVVKFVATIVFPDDPDLYEGYGRNGGGAPVCNLAGSTKCTSALLAYPYEDGRFYLWHYSEEWEIYGTDVIGDRFELLAFMPTQNGTTKDGRYNYETEFERSVFTVLPAPVPLPATAVLLPVGIGALAMMRKRRRAVS